MSGTKRAEPMLIAGALALMLGLGFVLGRSFGYSVYRREEVWVIHGTPDAGCRGGLGSGEVRFGLYGATADGSYRLGCGDWERAGVDVQIVCHCPP